VVNRRLILVGAVAMAVAIGGTVAGVVLAIGGGGAAAQSQSGPVDLHPVAGNFKPDHTKLSDCNAERCYEQARRSAGRASTTGSSNGPSTASPRKSG